MKNKLKTSSSSCHFGICTEILNVSNRRSSAIDAQTCPEEQDQLRLFFQKPFFESQRIPDFLRAEEKWVQPPLLGRGWK